MRPKLQHSEGELAGQCDRILSLFFDLESAGPQGILSRRTGNGFTSTTLDTLKYQISNDCSDNPYVLPIFLMLVGGKTEHLEVG